MSTVREGRRRHIGPIGTTARVVIGGLMLAFGANGGKFEYIHGHWQPSLSAAALAIGLLGFPAVLIAWQWMRLRRDQTRLEATGPLATAINIIGFALLIAISFVPAISYVGYAAFVFYGASMLLAAIRGYAGCEVLAVSNWLLHRDDQIGCLVLSPLDQLEQRLHQSRPSAPTSGA